MPSEQPGPGYRVARSIARSPAASRVRSTFLSNLPTAVFGTRPRTPSSPAPASGPPIATEEIRELGGISLGARPQHHAGQRPLAPAVVADPDHRGLLHGRVCHQPVLQINRGDPLAARLDHVLDPVADAEEPAVIQRAHVAGAQPAVTEFLRGRIQMIGPRDPGSPDLDLALGHAVPGQFLAGRADDAHLHAVETRPERIRQSTSSGVPPPPRRRQRQAADRAHLGHPQPWTIRSPYRSSNRSSITRGAAEPPELPIRSEDRSIS